jgi:hypothetical protein
VFFDTFFSLPAGAETSNEAEILLRASQRCRHGSLTSRTLLSFSDVTPKKKKGGKNVPEEVSQPKEQLDEATRSKLQMIFDHMTQSDEEKVRPCLLYVKS